MTTEEHNRIANENCVECDHIISKILCEIRSRKTVLYNEELIRAAAEMMNARANYARQIAKENDLIREKGNDGGMVHHLQ